MSFFFERKFCSILLIISVLLFFYVFYKSEVYWDGEKKDFYVTYYIVASIFILFSIVNFYINRKIQKILIFVSYMIYFILYVFEISVIYTKSEHFSLNQNIKSYEKQTGKKYDKRSKFEIYQDLKYQNIDFESSVFPVYKFIHKSEEKLPVYPLAGVSKINTLFCNEGGYYAFYESDRYGFNNPDIEWDQNNIEFLLVGDSYVHGHCVNRPNDIGSVLRKLSNKSVLNLGIHGDSLLLQYAKLIEYMPKNVKNVIWFYYEGNDIDDFEKELKSEILLKYLKDDNYTQNLKSKQKLIDDFWRKDIQKGISNYSNNKFSLNVSFTTFFQSIKLYHIRTLIKPETLKKTKKLDIPIEFKDVLLKANNFTKNKNSKLYFIYLPSWYRYTKANFNDASRQEIKDIVEDLKIPFIDMAEKFYDLKDPLEIYPFKKFSHFNPSGYKKIAEEIYNQN